MFPPHVRKKLIEVALPLDAINKAAAREKSIRHGHPSTLHLWWARRPLAAARAVIFAQMVDDPSEYAEELLADSQTKQQAERALKSRRPDQFGLTSEALASEHSAVRGSTGSSERQALRDMVAEIERERLFSILRELVLWKNTTNEDVLERARREIRRSWRRTCAEHADHPRAAELFNRQILPAFHDPFAGGGALPLEAQRLGLEAHASDLNPVAVLINKAMIEIPPKFAGREPLNPESRRDSGVVPRTWRGARGLAEDVRYYGRWMRDEAEKRIGHLYPRVEITPEMVRERSDLKPYEGRKLTVIAWLWARTVKSPNPAFAGVDVPLATTFMLSKQKGKEAYVEPVIEDGGYRFTVKAGIPADVRSVKRGTKSGGGGTPFLCLMSGSPMPFDYLRTEAKAGRMGARPMAIVAEGLRGRVYLTPPIDQELAASRARPDWAPDTALPERALGFRVQQYGMVRWGHLFTYRQLVALTNFSELIGEVTEHIWRDAMAAGLPDDGRPLRDGGKGATAYAQAVGVYLGLSLGRSANYWSSLTPWGGNFIVQTFGRQALPMVWDYAEGNPFSDSTGNWVRSLKWIEDVIIKALPASKHGQVQQVDAQSQGLSKDKVICTDPPYFDNIGYADLSDFFYVWLRKTLKPFFPDLFATMAVPKAAELVATPYRHGSKAAAESFFLSGMTEALRQLCNQAHPGFPVTIYYAFKQSERKTDTGITSTGWETFLDAVMQSGFCIGGTWPVRTERDKGLKTGTNVLASSIVLVCRRRPLDAPAATRREFLSALRSELPQAVRLLQTGNIAPVDLAQAAIGPGMAVYTRYALSCPSRGCGRRLRYGPVLRRRPTRARIHGSRIQVFGSSPSRFAQLSRTRRRAHRLQSPK